MVNSVNSNIQKGTTEEVLQWGKYITEPFKVGAVILDVRHHYVIVYANHAFEQLTAYSKEQFIGKSLSFFNGEKTNLAGVEECHARMLANESFAYTVLHFRQDGTAFWNEINFSPLTTSDEGRYYLLLMKDVTTKKNTKKLMKLERDVYALLEQGYNENQIFGKICEYVVENFYREIHCSIFLVENHSLKVIQENTMPEEFSNVLLEHEINKYLENPETARFLTEPIITENMQEHPMWKPLHQVAQKYDMRSSWSHPIKNQAEEVVGVVSIYFKEVIHPRPSDYLFLNQLAPIATLALKYLHQKKEILRLAFFDDATGLHNFASFEKKARQMQKQYEQIAIFIIEPSEFDNVVDLFKRFAGDELLRQIAERLQQVPVLQESLIARFTSSALVMAVPNISLQFLAKYYTQFEKEPFLIENKAFHVTLKVGTALLTPQDDIEEVVQRADSALNAALKMPGVSIQYFDEQQMELLKEDMEIRQYFLDALKNKEFYAVLQPKIDLTTGKISSFEALARWNSSVLGPVSPYKFISVGEKIGKIYKVDRAVLRDVLAWQQRRKQQGGSLYPVAVNISADHFYYPHFLKNIKRLIAEYDVDPKYITFEITESIELTNVLRAKKIIKELKKYGISVAIDDFGVGFSSLGYLQELPFEEIKIDKSFVDVITNPRMLAVMKTIVQLSENLQMKSVAEGVETEIQHDQLVQLGCHIGQGFYYFRPMPIDEIDELLKGS